ncbi:MAG: histidine phosphatase family protein [Clostridiales bacterium]|nr:histidine phosphatase family protein [Clostridiales bacterium]
MNKTIITVQHTESEHHLNRHAGAWGNWLLTDNGRKQAFEIGKWLLNEGCADGFVMYCSDLARASQTAEEINKTLHLTPVMTELIREVNAGEGNGKPWDWYDEHKIPAGEGYDPDYRPFPDAESDRDLWNRIKPFYEQLINSPEDKILIVSHGCTLGFLQAMLMNFEFDDLRKARFSGRSGSISKFTVDPDGRVTANYINLRV